MKLWGRFYTVFWCWSHWYLERARHLREDMWRIGPLRIRVLH